MGTPTINYSFNKPTKGADNNTWGDQLNSNWDKVDDLLSGGSAVSGIRITSGSGEFGTLTASSVNITGGNISGVTWSGNITADNIMFKNSF